MAKFYDSDGLKAIALYLDELIESGAVTQKRLAEESKRIAEKLGEQGITAGTIGNLRTNRANADGAIVRKMEPEIILSLAPCIPDPRSLVYRSDGVVDYDRSPKFARAEDFLEMARGRILLEKKPQGQISKGLPLWLRDQMVDRGLSPAQLAELAELPEQRMHDLLNGQVPSAREVFKLGRTLNDSDVEGVFEMIGTDLNAPIDTACKGGC